MAEAKIEREYVIPLRKEWLKVPYYKRTRKAVMAIKKFVARHMKIQDRDLSKVKLDVYLNNEIWFRGNKNPPARVKVKVVKEGDNVKVDFAEVPEYVQFVKRKAEKKHKKAEQKVESTLKPELKKEEKSEDQKKDEKEKEKSVEELNIKQAEQAAKANKHIVKAKAPEIKRMALDRH